MKVWRLIGGFAAAAVVALGFLAAVYLTAPKAPGLDLSREKPTQKGLYTFSIAPEGGEPSVGPMHAWVLSVSLPDGTPVEGATVAVGGGMPDHNHGLPTKPQMTQALGGGRYRVEGVKFTMTGWWVLRFEVAAQAGTDEATFNLSL